MVEVKLFFFSYYSKFTKQSHVLDHFACTRVAIRAIDVPSSLSPLIFFFPKGEVVVSENLPYRSTYNRFFASSCHRSGSINVAPWIVLTISSKLLQANVAPAVDTAVTTSVFHQPWTPEPRLLMLHPRPLSSSQGSMTSRSRSQWIPTNIRKHQSRCWLPLPRTQEHTRSPCSCMVSSLTAVPINRSWNTLPHLVSSWLPPRWTIYYLFIYMLPSFSCISNHQRFM